MKLFRATLIALACAIPVVAAAQWQWIDKDGRKVFSDRSPPSDVPADKILRQPGPKVAASPAVGAAPVATPAAAASAPKPGASAPKVTGKDPQLEAKKKQTEAAEAEKKKAQEEQAAATRADNCIRAKRAKAGLDSGARIARTNDKGEREFLDDAARAAEVKRTDAIITSECKPAG